MRVRLFSADTLASRSPFDREAGCPLEARLLVGAFHATKPRVTYRDNGAEFLIRGDQSGIRLHARCDRSPKLAGVGSEVALPLAASRATDTAQQQA